jgi:hypothetical protein
VRSTTPYKNKLKKKKRRKEEEDLDGSIPS